PLISLLLLFSPLTLADKHNKAAGISKQQAASIAQQEYSGRVLAVKHVNGIYHVKILSDKGEVRTVRVNSSTGDTLN
ncbi:MAG: hypothetical protein OEY87_00140, partial [Gammaproteobacteria bacterium]|nr:hypothetical protein [Gammaproteobacteria bacterium]